MALTLAVMPSLRGARQNMLISETHPKVLYYHLSGCRYDYATYQAGMNRQLSEWTRLPVETASDHEWDAVLSCFAVLEGMAGRWRRDLHRLPTLGSESLVQLGGPSYYYWPTEPSH